MTDIAELGFAVNTAGLKEGSSELDRFKGKAKEVEDQVKKTDTATAKAGDGAKKLGTDTKAASAALDGMAKSSGAAEAAAKRLGISVEEYNARTRATKTAIAEATAATQAAAPAMTTAATATRSLATAKQAATTAARAAAPAITATATAAQAVAPAMATAATAARAMAVSNNAALVSSANLAAGLNTLRPAVIAAGGAMGTLPAIAASARFGIAGIATAVTGGVGVSLANAADRIDNVRARLGALTGSFNTASAAVDRLKDSSNRGGASFNSLASAFEKLIVGMEKPPSEPGVFRVIRNGIESIYGQLQSIPGPAQKVTDVLGAMNDAMRRAHVPTGEIEKGLQLFAQNVDKLGRLTGDGLRKIAAEAPQFGRVIAQGLSGGLRNAEQQAKFLDNIPATIEQMTAAANQYDAAADRAFNPNRQQTVAASFEEMARSWDRLVQSIANTGAFSAINALLKGIADGLDVITRWASSGWENIFKTSGEWLQLFFETFGNGLRNIADLIAGPGAAVIGFLTDSIKGAINSAVNAVSSGVDAIIGMFNRLIEAAAAAASAIASALTSSPAPGGGSIPTISDTGDVTAPNAMGNAFSGGRVIPYALGGVITKPTLFPMADGMGLMGEAGPEAVMPLARTSDGKLGVSVADTSAAVPSDPFTDIELAIEDQTAELRNAFDSQADAIGGDINRSAADIVAAIEAGNILLQNITASAAPTGTASNTFGNSIEDFDRSVNSFGSAVQVASGGGQFTSSQQWAPAGAVPNPVMMSTRVINASPSSGGGGGGSSIAAALGFYDAWGGGRARGGGDAIFAGPFATGGSFMVPGSGGTDSVRVSMDATPGERVTVERPGSASAAGGVNIEGGVNISLHGITRPKEWLENDAVVRARIAQAVTEALDAR